MGLLVEVMNVVLPLIAGCNSADCTEVAIL
jgi:hypothetical protein